MTFIFNGQSRNYLTIDKDESRPFNAPIAHSMIDIPGRAGSVLTRSDTKVRELVIPIIVTYDNFRELQKIKEDMSKWLIHPEPKELIFLDEPDRTYMAILDGDIQLSEEWRVGKGEVRFLCPEPFKLGRPEAYIFADGIATVRNKGSVKTAPIIEIDVLDNITHLDIVSPEKYLRLGEPAPISAPNYERQTLILSDSLKTLNGWTDALDVDNGYVAGTMTATQSGFTATGFGTELSPRKWQGPSKKRSIPEPLQNFQLIATVDLHNIGYQTGMVEIYCLDAFGNTVAKVGIEDIMQSIAEIQAKFQLGNVANRKVQHYRTADYKPAWNNYTGVLRLFRDGNRFRPYFGLVQSDGRHVWVASNHLYIDAAEEYLAKITQIQIAIRKWPNTKEASMRVRDLKIWRLNDAIEGVPYIAGAGDKIIIDMEKSVILLNGEVRDDLKDFFSDFFDLETGVSVLTLSPTEKLSGKIIVREKFR